MAQDFAEIETHVRPLCWIPRVSSFSSNIADALSRGECEALRMLGFADVSEDAKKTLPGIWLSVEMKLGKTAEQQIPSGQKKCVSAV
jgi:hypothetical protein